MASRGIHPIIAGKEATVLLKNIEMNIPQNDSEIKRVFNKYFSGVSVVKMHKKYNDSSMRSKVQINSNLNEATLRNI